jgi:hypothetical protein
MIEDDAQLGQRRILHPPGGLVNRLEIRAQVQFTSAEIRTML